jgi:hypothetical protein
MTTENTTPLGVLREVWSAQAHGPGSSAGPGSTISLDDLDDPKVCKRTEGLDFGSFGDAEGVGSGGDLRTAWRSKLAREGKLADGPAAISIRELVLGAGNTDRADGEVSR